MESTDGGRALIVGAMAAVLSLCLLLWTCRPPDRRRVDAVPRRLIAHQSRHHRIGVVHHRALLGGGDVRALVLMPLAVIRSIGVSVMSTSSTLSWL